MKLFNDGNTKNQSKFKFSGSFTFKILNQSKHVISSNASFNSITNQDLHLNKSNDENLLYENKGSYEESLDSQIKTAPSTSFNSATDAINYHISNQLKMAKKPKLIKLQLKGFRSKKSVYNIGRWTEEEHRRFIEAILKYGNDWKNVQKHIRTRSSTQSRSHSQKFFLKIKNYDLFDFKDRKPCISSLNDLAKNLEEKQIESMTDLLISYEYQENPDKKNTNEKLLQKKRKKEQNYYYEEDNESKNYNNANYNNLAHFNYYNNIQFSGMFTRGRKRSLSLSINRNEKEFYPIDKNDDFNDQFLNAFTQKNRRLSFEDNILLLFTNAIMDDKRKVSLDKSKKINRKNDKEIIEEPNTIDEDEFDNLVNYAGNFVMSN